MVVTAALCGVINFGVLAVASAIKKSNPPVAPPNMNQGDKEQWERGQRAAPLFDFACLGLLSIGYVPAFLGGLKLQRGLGRTMGILGAVCVMLPCSPGFLIGLPVGIWGLIALANEDVKYVIDHIERETERDNRRRR